MVKMQKLKPERNFRVDDNITLQEVIRRYEQKITVTGIAHGFDSIGKKVFVSLGNDIEAILPFEEVSLEELRYITKIPVQVKAILKKGTIRAKISKIEDDKIYLSRKANLLEALDTVKNNIGGFFRATVENIDGHCVFCDIGEGVVAYCKIEEVTRIRIKDVRGWLEKGQKVKVKVTDYSEESNLVWCSIKRGSFGDYSAFKRGMHVKARVGNAILGNDGNITGFYVEITPAISGITDYNPMYYNGELPKYGDMVKCYIKNVDEYNHKMKLNLID